MHFHGVSLPRRRRWYFTVRDWTFPCLASVSRLTRSFLFPTGRRTGGERRPWPSFARLFNLLRAPSKRWWCKLTSWSQAWRFFFTRNEPNGRDFRREATGHEPKGVSSRSMDLCTEETRTHTHTHKGRLYIVGPRSGVGRQRRRACRGSAKDGRMRALKEDMDVRGKHRSQERLLLAILPSRYPMHRNCSLRHQQPTPPFPIMRPLFSSTFLHDQPHFSRFVLPFHGTPNSILYPRR